MYVNSSMIGINRPFSELPIKSQSSQRSNGNSEGFENLLRQKLSAVPQEVNEAKVDARKNTAAKDLQGRRMNKPEISTASPKEVSTDTDEAQQSERLTASDKTKVEGNQTAKEATVDKTEEVAAVTEELTTEPVDNENVEQMVNQLMPLLDLLSLLTDELQLPVNGGFKFDAASLESLQSMIEPLKDVLGQLTQAMAYMPQQDKNATLDQLNELTQQVEKMLGDLVQTPESETVDLKAFSELLSKMERSQDNLKQLVTKPQSVNPEMTVITDKSDESQPVNAIKPVNGDGKTEDKNAKGEEHFNGKDKMSLKVTEKSESKPNQVTQSVNGNEFQAKLESAAIAFNSKSEAVVPSKMSLQSLIMDQLTNVSKMQVRTTEAGTFMSMKLNPEVLGNVEIKLEIVKNVLQAEINVENMIVKGALESNLSDLKNALSDKGYQVEQINVSVGDKQSDNNGKQQEQRQQTAKWQLDELDDKEIRQIRLKDLTEATLSYLG